MKRKTNYDLIVVGGGLAGVGAAIGAAKEGLSVLLIEKGGFLGGAISNCSINPFMKHAVFNEKDERIVINRGIFIELIEKLKEMDGIVNNSCFNEEYVKLLLDKMTTDAGVDVLFHTYFIDVIKDGDTIKAIDVDTRNGRMTFSAKYFIDASGDAALAFKAGCPYKIGREEDNLCQPMTLCFRMANVDMEKVMNSRAQINEMYNKAQAEGKIKNPRENVLLFWHTSEGVLHLNSTRIVKRSPLDAYDLSIAERDAREQEYELFKFMKENCPGCENATLLISAPEIGVRESRMIEGEYTINEDDIVSCRKFDDTIAVGAYSIDIHSPDGSGTKIVKIEQGKYYSIPYKSLIPKGVKNMLVAGRCISSTHTAQSAYRVLPIVACIGQGAGIAIAVANNDNTDTRNVDINKVHKIMEKQDLIYK
ncbi:MAG: FAD-dependent oxidoreductase [Ruminococcaceae bacterium]|nr:FAD-dependent oxidoreductase [Oscillospiraceae bacterium]